MAGVKGRSGGARAGAGRKKNPENEGAEYSASTEGMTPLEALEHFQNDPAVPVALRIKAATAAAPFKHKKLGESGKADQNKPAADAAPSKYATRKGPGAAVKH
jgi:phage terminase small subunit